MNVVYKAIITHQNLRTGVTATEYEAYGFDKDALAQLMYAECYICAPKSDWLPDSGWDAVETCAGYAKTKYANYYARILPVPTVC